MYKPQNHGLSAYNQLNIFDDSMDENANMISDWAVPWSDLMMVMFVLFVVLYVYASTQKDIMLVFTDRNSLAQNVQSSSELDGVIERIDSTYDLETPEAKADHLNLVYKSMQHDVSVNRYGDDVHVVLRGSRFFQNGHSEILSTAEGYLQEVAEIMRMSHGQIQVIGYTAHFENRGGDGFLLSAERAVDVASYFINKAKIKPARFSIVGRGEYKPDIPEIKAQTDLNQRVEIIIHLGK